MSLASGHRVIRERESRMGHFFSGSFFASSFFMFMLLLPDFFAALLLFISQQDPLQSLCTAVFVPFFASEVGAEDAVAATVKMAKTNKAMMFFIQLPFKKTCCSLII